MVESQANCSGSGCEGNSVEKSKAISIEKTMYMS